MRIAVVGHIRHPIAEPFQGGMEAHCHQLVQGLSARGHDVTLFAAGDSDLPNITKIAEHPYETVLPWKDWRGTARLAAYQDAAFTAAWQHIGAETFDVVHNNSLFAPLIDWAARDGVPMLSSQHVPPFGAMREAVERARDVDCVCFTVTSLHQLSLWNAAARSDFLVVNNGIDTTQWVETPYRTERLLWFGRITETKGLREAVQAALLADVQLDIVGALEDPVYFDSYVRPFLGHNIRYLGHLSGASLRRCVASARAVLVTPLWDEPFGLVAAEAMSCGVPVIAFDRGAMAEVLGDCGRLVPAGDVSGLADAMTTAEHLNGAMCRHRATEFFSIDRMLSGYEVGYRRCMGSKSAPVYAAADSPRASSAASTDALLA